MAIKYIYRFTLNKKQISEEWVEKVLDGTTIKEKKEVETVVSTEFGLKKPTKAQKDEIDLSYKAHFSEAVRRKVMPIAELQKQINDRDGVFSRKEIQRKTDIIKSFTDKQDELAKITDKDDPAFKAIVADLQSYLGELDDINQKESALYSQSAEGYAKNKIIFEILALNSFNITDNKDYFVGRTLEEKLENIQDVDEGADDYARKALKVFYSTVSAYFTNDKLTQTEFDAALRPLIDE